MRPFEALVRREVREHGLAAAVSAAAALAGSLAVTWFVLRRSETHDVDVGATLAYVVPCAAAVPAVVVAADAAAAFGAGSFAAFRRCRSDAVPRLRVIAVGSAVALVLAAPAVAVAAIEVQRYFGIWPGDPDVSIRQIVASPDGRLIAMV